MANKKPKQNKPKTGLARCLELASNKKGLVFLSAILSSLAAIASFVPYIAVYFIISSILKVYPNLELLDMSKVMNYGWIALAGIIANILLYFLAIFSSHMAAFGTLYELKLHFAEHITKIPLGYHLTIGSGRLRKIMDENIESIEGFIAHQFPDFVASVTAPIVMAPRSRNRRRTEFFHPGPHGAATTFHAPPPAPHSRGWLGTSAGPLPSGRARTDPRPSPGSTPARSPAG